MNRRGVLSLFISAPLLKWIPKKHTRPALREDALNADVTETVNKMRIHNGGDPSDGISLRMIRQYDLRPISRAEVLYIPVHPNSILGEEIRIKTALINQ